MTSPSPAQAMTTGKELYLRLLRYVLPYKWRFGVGVVAMMAYALTDVALAALLKPFLDETFVEKDYTFLMWAPLGVVCLFFVRGVTNFVSNVSFVDVSTRVVFDLRLEMFDRLIRLPTQFFHNNPTGNTISRLTYDVNNVANAATQGLTVLIKDSVTVIGLIIWLVWLDWQLSAFLVILAPLIALVAWVIGKRLRILSRALQTAFGDLTHRLEETVRGQKIVKIFGGMDTEKERFHHVANWVRRYHFKRHVAASSSVPIVEFIGAIIMAVIIYIGTNRDEAISVGAFVSFFAALGLLFSPIKRLTKLNDPIQRALAAAESVFGMIDEPTEPNPGRDTVGGRSQGELRFRSLRFRYPEGDRDALADINVDIAQRQTVALVGSSGSGKSTLASMLPRMYDLDQGSIELDGKDIRELNLSELRSQIAYVSQEVTLFNATVAENIAYGELSGATPEEIRAAADAARVTEFVDKLPDGFDTLIGEDGVRLSGGQRQRLAIARALLKDAPVLVLDEATSALDTESEFLVQQAIDNLSANRTTIVIAHRLSTVEHADRILVLDHGCIVEDGTHETLVKQGGRYADLYKRQFLDSAG